MIYEQSKVIAPGYLHCDYEGRIVIRIRLMGKESQGLVFLKNKITFTKDKMRMDSNTQGHAILPHVDRFSVM